MNDLHSICLAAVNEPFSRWLGLRVDHPEPESFQLTLPYKEQNSNPGRQVHGGVVASLLVTASRIAALAGIRASEPYAASTLDLNVGYLASAVGEEITGRAQLLRRGKELCYVRSEVTTAESKAIGTATVVYRAAPGLDPAPVPAESTAHEAAPAEVSSFTRMLAAGGFIAGVGIVPEHMKAGEARARLPFNERNCDFAGALHEGALSALIDTCGSFSAWSLVSPRPGMRASTVALDVNFVAPARNLAVIARSRTVARRREIFFNQVEVEAEDNTLVARGTVIYRIVLPE